MIEHLCFGYPNVKTQEFIAQSIAEILKEEGKPMKCMELTLKIVDDNEYRFSCQKVSAVLKKMVTANIVKRIETELPDTIEVSRKDSTKKTIHLKEIKFMLL